MKIKKLNSQKGFIQHYFHQIFYTTVKIFSMKNNYEKISKYRQHKSSAGFIISIVTFLVLTSMLAMGVSMSSLIFYRQQIATNSFQSTQSYYAAESGIEDALLKIKNNAAVAGSTYTIPVSDATVTVTIPDLVGGQRALTSSSNNQGIIREIQAVSIFDTSGASFHYGVQAGGGFSLNNGSEIVGNVFANGDVKGTGTIDNNVVTTSTHGICGGNANCGGTGMTITHDVKVYSCKNATIGGVLTITTGGTNNCGGNPLSASQVSNENMPISQSQIDSWKNSATTACNSTDVANLAGINKSVTLGPCKVTGDLSIGNGSTLTMKGNVYVTGNVTFGNKSYVYLDSAFGFTSGVLIEDGTLTVNNNVTIKSLAQTGSGIIFLSTSSSGSTSTCSSNAICVNNGGTVDGATLYASQGGIYLNNNAHLHQITAYKDITLGNNINLQYDIGLASPFFTGGPAGSLKVTNWSE